MTKKSTTITAGIALLAGLSAQAQEPSQITIENTEIAADLVEELVLQRQVIVSPKGDLKIDKSLFDVLRERGILKDKGLIHGATDTGSKQCKSM